MENEPREKTEENSGTETSASPAAKKKEPPAFAWKLTGYADGLTLTLLKCVDKKDADAQMERLQAEGYYTGLLVSAIDDTVPPPPDTKNRWKPEPIPEPSKSKKAAARVKAPKKPLTPSIIRGPKPKVAVAKEKTAKKATAKKTTKTKATKTTKKAVKKTVKKVVKAKTVTTAKKATKAARAKKAKAKKRKK